MIDLDPEWCRRVSREMAGLPFPLADMPTFYLHAVAVILPGAEMCDELGPYPGRDTDEALMAEVLAGTEEGD